MTTMSTNTHSTTFTISNARYVTSKIKTDLKLLQRAYGSPSDTGIENFGEEAAQLLKIGYLGTVNYGYRRDEQWILALRYSAGANGTIVTDERAGGIPRGQDVTNASFHSYLNYSAGWWTLTEQQRNEIKAALPITRSGGVEPGCGTGYWTTDRSYSSNGSGVARGTFQSL